MDSASTEGASHALLGAWGAAGSSPLLCSYLLRCWRWFWGAGWGPPGARAACATSPAWRLPQLLPLHVVSSSLVQLRARGCSAGCRCLHTPVNSPCRGGWAALGGARATCSHPVRSRRIYRLVEPLAHLQRAARALRAMRIPAPPRVAGCSCRWGCPRSLGAAWLVGVRLCRRPPSPLTWLQQRVPRGRARWDVLACRSPPWQLALGAARSPGSSSVYLRVAVIPPRAPRSQPSQSS